jgi:hypothetical protein
MTDLTALVTTARQRLPLRTMMEQRNRTPANGNWKSFPKCPYCGKDGAGLFDKGGRHRFKCHHTSCPSGTAGEKGAWDEVGFLAYELGVSRKEAFKTWMKEAGVELPVRRQAPHREPPRNEYLPSEDERVEEEDLPPEAWAMEPEPPSAAKSDQSSIQEPCQSTDGSSFSVAADGELAVPSPPPVADGANASPAAPAGAPTPQPGEASLSPAEGTAGATGAEPKAQDAAPPAENVQVLESVQTPAEPPEADAPEEEGQAPSLVAQAFRWLHERIPLLKEDLRKCAQKRGWAPDTCIELGLRSSPRSNEGLLLEMPKHFPINVLLDAGLYVRGDGPKDEPRPNRQFFGWGVAGKRKGIDGEDEDVWDWTHPILIAYLNKAGEVMELRPHKRTQKAAHPRLYIPRRWGGIDGPRKEPNFALITEGEFKAGAIYQELRDRGIAAALPGITMSKLLWGEIVDWLRDELPYGRPVITVFDNEDKATEGLPGYKAVEWKRHDSQLWARYLAWRLSKEGFSATVATLPNDWRDASGKADWDGALAFLLNQLG